MTPGLATRSLVSQVIFSAGSVVALGAVAKSMPSANLGVVVTVMAVQAVLNSALRGYCVLALTVYRSTWRRHPRDLPILAGASALCAAGLVVVAFPVVLLTHDLAPAPWLVAVLGWQVAVLCADAIRAYDAILGSFWPAHVGALLGMLAFAGVVSYLQETRVVTLVLLTSGSLITVALLVRSSRRTALGGEPVGSRDRFSVAREGTWVASGLGSALLYVSVASPALAAGWQIANQVVASPTGYVGSAVNTAATRELVRRSETSGRSFGVLSAWLAILIAVCAGSVLVASAATLTPVLIALVGPIWTSARDLLVPCVAYILFFQLTLVLAILLRVAGRRRVDAVVLVLTVVGGATFAVLAVHRPEWLDGMLLLPSAMVLGITTWFLGTRLKAG